MFNVIERLNKDVFEIYIAVNKAGGSLYDEVVGKGYKVLVHPFSAETTKGILNKINRLRSIAAYYKPYGFSIWQSFNWSSDYTEAVIAKLAGAKYVYVKKNMNWNRRAWKVKSRLSSAIVARNTTMLKTMFADGAYRHKVHFITGGVDTSRFYNASSTYKEDIGLPAESVLISCVAQLVRTKGQDTLIKAIKGLPNVYLVLAGRFVDETYTQYLKTLAKELGVEHNVIFAGGLSDVNTLLNATDIFVLPTNKHSGHEEGCPVALLEAMACGAPCIASNVAGSNDLIKHEYTGLLFTPANEEELHTCLKRYITDPLLAKRMSKNARALIAENHTLQMESVAFEKLYRKLAGIV